MVEGIIVVMGVIVFVNFVVVVVKFVGVVEGIDVRFLGSFVCVDVVAVKFFSNDFGFVVVGVVVIVVFVFGEFVVEFVGVVVGVVAGFVVVVVVGKFVGVEVGVMVVIDGVCAAVDAMGAIDVDVVFVVNVMVALCVGFADVVSVKDSVLAVKDSIVSVNINTGSLVLIVMAVLVDIFRDDVVSLVAQVVFLVVLLVLLNVQVVPELLYVAVIKVKLFYNCGILCQEKTRGL